MKRSVLAAALLLLVVALYPQPPAVAGAPGAIFSCNATGQFGRVDPIVSPGAQSAHEHVFFGNRQVDTVETTESLRSTPTTCVEQSNHSAYWMPSVYRNGVALLPATSKHMLAYYRCRLKDCSQVPSFPDDTKLVFGNANATSPSENPALSAGLGGWRCGTGGGAFAPTPPATCSAQILVASVTFPPVDGLRVQLYFRWKLPSSDVGTITLGAIGAPPYTLHADYFFGWERQAFENFMDRCLRAFIDCKQNPAV